MGQNVSVLGQGGKVRNLIDFAILNRNTKKYSDRLSHFCPETEYKYHSKVEELKNTLCRKIFTANYEFSIFFGIFIADLEGF